MNLKQSIQTILLGLALCFWLLVGMDPPPLLAAPLKDATPIPKIDMQTIAEKPVDLETGVDRFLTSMPAGYYTIATVEKLKDLLKDPQTLLVDVREPSEYRSAHIPNAINVPLRTLTHSQKQIPHERPVVLYCSSGYRSAMGVMTLHLMGYENVRGFPPSFAGWQAAEEAIASR